MFLSNGMKSHYYVNRSMNDDCVQYSITYHSSNNELKYVGFIYFQILIIGMIGNIEIRIDSNIGSMIVISMMK